jgi:hypothetical protein
MNYVSPPSVLPTGSRVGYYMKFACTADVDIAQHLQSIQNYCDQNGLILISVIEQTQHKQLRENPNLLIEIFRDFQQTHSLDGILIYGYARLLRDAKQTMVLIREITQNDDITVHSLTDPLPPSREMQALFLSMAYQENEE